MRFGDEAQIISIINLGLDVGTGMILSKLLGVTGLISQTGEQAMTSLHASGATSSMKPPKATPALFPVSAYGSR
ncbi:hypothetical protein LP7551_01842 [Roseibium album]|nr:hypothetical protein LP7551_01842 [Roseibium album]